jgi:hypothetical protein
VKVPLFGFLVDLILIRMLWTIKYTVAYVLIVCSKPISDGFVYGKCYNCHLQHDLNLLSVWRL